MEHGIALVILTWMQRVSFIISSKEKNKQSIMVVIEMNDSEDIQQYCDICISRAYCNYYLKNKNKWQKKCPWYLSFLPSFNSLLKLIAMCVVLILAQGPTLLDTILSCDGWKWNDTLHRKRKKKNNTNKHFRMGNNSLKRPADAQCDGSCAFRHVEINLSHRHQLTHSRRMND